MIEKIAAAIAKRQAEKPYLFIMVIIALTIVLSAGIPNIFKNIEPSLEKVLPQKIEEVSIMNDMRTQFGADMMYLLVYAQPPVYEVTTPDLLKYVDTLSQKLRQRDYILEVSNAADIIKSHLGFVPESSEAIKTYIAQNPMITEFINHDRSFTVIRIRSDTGASSQIISQVTQAIEKDVKSLESLNPGSRIQMTGFNAIDKATFEIIISDFMYITAVSMLLVLAVVSITFRSIKKAFITISVVFAALVWTMGIVGYLQMTVTVVSMVAAAMIIGLGIDFGVHQVHTYYHHRKHSDAKKSLKETLNELLLAMIGASATTISGFLALLFGILPAMQNLGIILTVGIFSTLINAVFLLPAVIFISDGGK